MRVFFIFYKGVPLNSYGGGGARVGVHFLGAATLYRRTNHALNIYHLFSSVMIYILLGVFLYTGDMLHGSLSI